METLALEATHIATLSLEAVTQEKTYHDTMSSSCGGCNENIRKPNPARHLIHPSSTTSLAQKRVGPVVLVATRRQDCLIPP